MSSPALIAASALALCAVLCQAGYLYADSTMEFGSEYGIVKWDPDQQQAAPKVIVSLDIVDLGDGFYNGGCVDAAGGAAYMILGNGTSSGPYLLIKIDLATGNHTGPTKFTLPRANILQWWVWSPALSKIVTAYYTKDTLTVIGLDPASLAVINIAAIPLKLDYYPGNVALDPAENIMYFTHQDHSTTTLYCVNCTSGKVSSYAFPAGHNVEEITWDSVNQRLIALNVTYSWLGPIPTDPTDHVVTIEPSEGFATTQYALPDRTLSKLLWGIAANNGTTYWHGVLQMGPGSFDHVVSWNLPANTFAVQNLLQWVQPQSWMVYLDS